MKNRFVSKKTYWLQYLKYRFIPPFKIWNRAWKAFIISVLLVILLPICQVYLTKHKYEKRKGVIKNIYIKEFGMNENEISYVIFNYTLENDSNQYGQQWEFDNNLFMRSLIFNKRNIPDYFKISSGDTLEFYTLTNPSYFYYLLTADKENKGKIKLSKIDHNNIINCYGLYLNNQAILRFYNHRYVTHSFIGLSIIPLILAALCLIIFFPYFMFGDFMSYKEYKRYIENGHDI